MQRGLMSFKLQGYGGGVGRGWWVPGHLEHVLCVCGCMPMCICISAYVCVCICIHVYVHMCVYVYAHMGVCLRGFVLES